MRADYDKKIETFTHLHCHSSYSLLDGIGKPADNAKRAADIGQQALALTDHGTCAGLYEFQTACDKVGVKPILGNEFYFVEDRHVKGLSEEEKESLTKEEQQEIIKIRQANPHLILLAETDQGLQNIYRLNYLANKEGFYGKPRVDLNLLQQYNEGIIATTTCIISPYAKYYFRGETDKMRSLFDKMYGIFGKDRYFVELHPHEKFNFRNGTDPDQHAQREYNFAMVEMFRKNYDIRCILANDAHYPEKKHNDVHGFMFNINTNGKYDETSCKNLYIASEDDMRSFWHGNHHDESIDNSYLDEAIETTKEIANRCHGRIDVESLKEPKFSVPVGYDNNKQYIVELLKDALIKKIEDGEVAEDKSDEYIERVRTELELIADKGYVDYFLLTRDFCDWAYRNDIVQSPGRGSAAGSLICWLLGITRVDPLKYDLFFERFMNPERIKEPDIDNDFQDSRRQEVKDYVGKKWGAANIASCAAYSRYTANTLLREVFKHYEIDFKTSNRIAKTISGHVSLNKDMTSFTDIVASNKDVREFLTTLDEEKRHSIVHILDTVMGNVRNVTIAGGGTIISSQPLHELMPLRRSKDEGIITEWQVEELTKMKFLKIDILGISTLSVLKTIMDQVGMSLDELYALPMEREELTPDEQVHYDQAYKLLQEGETQGIFQFGGSNITRCLTKVKPQNLNDLAAVNAIYRPGVIKMGSLEKFLNRRNGDEKSVNDIHPLFEEILAPTEYIMIYQEQFIQMFNKLGLDFGKADLMRRMAEANDKDACYKYLEEHLYSNPELMALSAEETHKVADKIIEGAGYLFNKSHAICYSQLAYWTAYMKAKFPDRFTEVMFNHHVSDKDNLAITLTMARKLLKDPTISLGDINTFAKDYKVVGNDITIGVKSVKGIGDSVINKVLKNRPSGGWLTFQEFMVDNIYKKMIPYKGMQLFTTLGLFDGIPINGSGVTVSRKALVDIIEVVSQLSTAPKKKFRQMMEKVTGEADTKLENLFGKEHLEQIISLFDIDTETEYTEVEIINFEVENVGFRINEDKERQEALKTCVNEMNITHISDFDEDNQVKKHFWSIIRSVELLKTKKGKPYANVRLDDGTSFRIWHNKLVYIQPELLPGRVVMVKLDADTFGRSLSWDKYSFMCEEDILKLYKEVSS